MKNETYDMSIYLGCNLMYRTRGGIYPLKQISQTEEQTRVGLGKDSGLIYFDINDENIFPLLKTIRKIHIDIRSFHVPNAIKEAILYAYHEQNENDTFYRILTQKSSAVIARESLQLLAKMHYDVYDLITQKRAIEIPNRENEIKTKQIIWNEVLVERNRQDELYGVIYHDCISKELFLLGKTPNPETITRFYELPDVSRVKYMNEYVISRGDLNWANIALEEFTEAITELDVAKRRKEIIQLIAVCVAWVESIDQKNN